MVNIIELLQSKKFFVFWAISLLAIKLWLVGCHYLMATDSPHDSLLFVRQAHSLLSGTWLGPYDQFVMIKGPFYSFFIAIIYLLNVPLLNAQQIVYWFASLAAIWAFYPVVRRKWLLPFLFLFFLFNPFSYDYPWTARVYRLGIYPSLGLLTFSCVAGLALRLRIFRRTAPIWSVAAGVFLSAFWNTREESLWIIPSLLLLLLPIVPALHNRKFSRKTFGFGLAVLPFLMLLGANYILKTINQRQYNVPAVIELKSPEFKSAYGGLLRIKSKHWRQHYPVVRDAREHAYAVSPSFRELKPFIDGPIGKRWQELARSDDIPAEYFIWLFRDAVAYAGHAESGPDALQFYAKMGKEVDQACEDGRLDCRPRFTSLIPVWHKEYNSQLLPSFFSILKRIITFSDFSADTEGMMSSGSGSIMVTYETVTREKLLTSRRDRLKADPEYHRRINRQKIKILNKIGWIYQKAIFPLFLLALLSFSFMVGRCILRRKNLFFTVVSGAALTGLLAVTSVLNLYFITWYVYIERPMHTAYPLLLLFIMTVFLELSDAFSFSTRQDDIETNIKEQFS